MPHRWEEIDPAGATWERQMCEEQEEELGYNPGVNVVHRQVELNVVHSFDVYVGDSRREKVVDVHR